MLTTVKLSYAQNLRRCQVHTENFLSKSNHLYYSGMINNPPPDIFRTPLTFTASINGIYSLELVF